MYLIANIKCLKLLKQILLKKKQCELFARDTITQHLFHYEFLDIQK